MNPKSIGNSDNIEIKQFNISLSNRQAIEAVKGYFRPFQGTFGKYGRGILTYDGFYYENMSVFFGHNKKTKCSIIVFLGDEGTKQLEKFRDNFLNFAPNQHLAEFFTLSNLQAAIQMPAPNFIKIGSDAVKGFEATVKAQQKSIPKVSMKNNEILFVGGSTGKMTLEIKGISDAAGRVKNLEVVFRAKDQGNNQAMLTFLNSIDSTANTIVAFLMLKQLGRVTLSPVLEHIREKLIKSYAVGNVIEYAQLTPRATTAHGKFILRPLSGIRNKMLKESSAEEAADLFAEWFKVLVQEDLRSIPNYQQFLAQLTEALKNLDSSILDANSGKDAVPDFDDVFSSLGDGTGRLSPDEGEGSEPDEGSEGEEDEGSEPDEGSEGEEDDESLSQADLEVTAALAADGGSGSSGNPVTSSYGPNSFPPFFTAEENAIILGTLFTDAHIQKRGPDSYRLKITHSDKAVDYINWKHRRLLRLCDTTQPPTLATDTKGYSTYTFYATSDKAYEYYHKLFYHPVQVPGKKKVKYVKRLTSDVIASLPTDKLLFGLFLMVVYFDDGSIRNDAHSGRVATHSFSKEQQQLFVDYIKEKYGITMTLPKHTTKSKQFYMSILAETFENFLDLIRPHVHEVPTMHYKLKHFQERRAEEAAGLLEAGQGEASDNEHKEASDGEQGEGESESGQLQT